MPTWGDIPVNKGISFNELYQLVYNEYKIKRLNNFSGSSKLVNKATFVDKCFAEFNATYSSNRIISKGAGTYLGGNITVKDLEPINIFKQSNGKIIVCNRKPITVNEVYYGSLIRFNSDGTIDETFQFNHKSFYLWNGRTDSYKRTFTAWAYTVAELPDGRLVVGGNFNGFTTSPSAVPDINTPHGIVILDANGYYNSGDTLNKMVGINYIYGITGSTSISYAGRVDYGIFGGDFDDQYVGIGSSGTLSEYSVSPTIKSIICDNNYIYIAGDFEGFSGYNDISRWAWRIIRINISTAKGENFGSIKGFSASDMTSTGPYARVQKIEFRSGGQYIYVSGYFDEYYTLNGNVTACSNFTCIDKSTGEINPLFSNIRFTQISTTKSEIVDFITNVYGYIYVVGHFRDIQDSSTNVSYQRNGYAIIANNGNINHPFNQNLAANQDGFYYSGALNLSVNLIGDWQVLINGFFNDITPSYINKFGLAVFNGQNGNIITSDIGYNRSSPDSTTYTVKPTTVPSTAITEPNFSYEYIYYDTPLLGSTYSKCLNYLIKEQIFKYDNNTFYISTTKGDNTFNKGVMISLYATRFLNSIKMDSSGNIDMLW